MFEVASSDLVNMGITVVSYTLKDIRDEEVSKNKQIAERATSESLQTQPCARGDMETKNIEIAERPTPESLQIRPCERGNMETKNI